MKISFSSFFWTRKKERIGIRKNIVLLEIPFTHLLSRISFTDEILTKLSKSLPTELEFAELIHEPTESYHNYKRKIDYLEKIGDEWRFSGELEGGLFQGVFNTKEDKGYIQHLPSSFLNQLLKFGIPV